MEVTFWGVRGSIPAPGPSTVRFGGNTSCLSLRTSGDKLVILDCGTGARNLGNSLLGGPFGKGGGEATILLSHAHWDHIQGFPFFVPLYIQGNTFHIYGGAKSSSMLEGILEGQMAPQYFPVQTLKNMGASIEILAIAEGEPLTLGGCKVTARTNPHGRSGALAFRVEDAGRVLVYASDAGYATTGAPKESIELYRGADILVHDSTYTPDDRRRYLDRGFSSVDDAVTVAVAAKVKRLVLFHYDQDYTDADVDALVARARRLLDEAGGQAIEVSGAVEGETLSV
ncbi:MAG: beta-lactamase domain protein [Myxococcales bacterium]|jgi:phosphoribosyl 1,2-cyclic phosphodiesterase|nr:beta-lactamase domain protein [Myxococcales bacterium]